MSGYSIERLLFEDIQGKKIEAAFEGGQVTSDAGVLLLRKVERRLGLVRRIAKILRDRRHPGYTRHSIREMLAQHLLVTEGGMDQAGVFHRLPHLDDSRLAEIFAHEVLRLLVGKGLLSPEWAERILSWRHTGFNVHSGYYGLYANAHRGKVRKARRVPVVLGMLEEELPRVPSKGWAEMIRKVYEVDPMICPRCGGRMRVASASMPREKSKFL